MNKNCTWLKRRIGWSCFALAMVLSAAIASLAGAQSSTFGKTYTKIYNSGVLSLGADESLQLTIVNNNNVSDPALLTLPASEESCTFVARFLDGNGNTLQEQQQTLQPGQNFSFSVSGQKTVQARVDVSPGTSSGFAGEIADQCVVSSEILNSSNDPVLFPPPVNTLDLQVAPAACIDACRVDCRTACSRGDIQGCSFCMDACIDRCPKDCR
jgi:hypothetical protein